MNYLELNLICPISLTPFLVFSLYNIFSFLFPQYFAIFIFLIITANRNIAVQMYFLKGLICLTPKNTGYCFNFFTLFSKCMLQNPNILYFLEMPIVNTSVEEFESIIPQPFSTPMSYVSVSKSDVT